MKTLIKIFENLICMGWVSQPGRENLAPTTVISLLLLFTACAPQAASFNPLLQSQPYVLSISPEPYHILDKLEEVSVTFSHPVDPKTVSDKTVYVTPGEVDKKDVKNEEILKVSGNIETSSDAQTLTWQPQENIAPGDYSLVITTDVQANNHISFNQNPGQDPEPFVAVFHVGLESAGQYSSSSDSTSPTSPSTSPTLHRPTFLVINEVIYDASGSDTDGNEFIELYGTPESDLDQYQIMIVNGSDGSIIDTLTLPSGSKMRESGIFLIADAKTNDSKHSNIPNPDFIDNFDPQNGPDSIQLLDSQGHLLDAITYGEGALTLGHNGLPTGEGSPASDVSNGHSLSRMNGINTDSNVDDFVDLANPTPGEI